MPTYDYECTKCGHTFETFQSMSDEPLEKCPTCAKNGLKRLIGGGLGVIFKGSGFYVTDSRGGKGSTTGSKGSGDSASPAKSSGDSSSDSSSTSSTSDSSSSASSKPKPEKSKSESKAAT